MKTVAVIALTEQGRALSATIQDVLPYEVRRFCFYKYADANAEKFDNLAALTACVFPEFDALIFVCACGIAVRMIAPLIQSKEHDPAVLVTDVHGRFVIPLLSGHLGGANALAEQLAEKIGAEPVITTATDTGGQFSPDSFAAANQLVITDLNAAKQIAAAVLSGEKIGLSCVYRYRNLPPELTVSADTKYGIVIADSAAESPYPVTLHLIPKNIVVGIGCKKGTSAQQIENAVRAALAENAVDPRRICKAASIDLKANETGLLQFCTKTHISLQTFSAEKLMQISGDFAHSEFAEKMTGADNICERSAVLCSGGMRIIPKTAYNGVTVSAAEIPVEIDFEKRML